MPYVKKKVEDFTWFGNTAYIYGKRPTTHISTLFQSLCKSSNYPFWSTVARENSISSSSSSSYDGAIKFDQLLLFSATGQQGQGPLFFIIHYLRSKFSRTKKSGMTYLLSTNSNWRPWGKDFLLCVLNVFTQLHTPKIQRQNHRSHNTTLRLFPGGSSCTEFKPMWRLWGHVLYY